MAAMLDWTFSIQHIIWPIFAIIFISRSTAQQSSISLFSFSPREISSPFIKTNNWRDTFLWPGKASLFFIRFTRPSPRRFSPSSLSLQSALQYCFFYFLSISSAPSFLTFLYIYSIEMSIFLLKAVEISIVWDSCYFCTFHTDELKLQLAKSPLVWSQFQNVFNELR